jgi:hypothetical protein
MAFGLIMTSLGRRRLALMAVRRDEQQFAAAGEEVTGDLDIRRKKRRAPRAEPCNPSGA